MRLEEEGTASSAWPNHLSLPLGPIAAEPLWQEDEAAFEAAVARVAKRILTVLPRINVRPLMPPHGPVWPRMARHTPYGPSCPYGPIMPRVAPHTPYGPSCPVWPLMLLWPP